MRTHQILVPLFVISLFGIACTGCSSHRATLDEINNVRTYSVSVETVFEAVRSFCRKESFIIDRADPESASFFAHKVIGRGGFTAGYSGAGGDKRTVIMHVKGKRLGGGKTEITTHFVYGDGLINTTREEENILIDNYSMLLKTLDSEVK